VVGEISGIVASVLWTIGVYVLTFQVEESNAQRRFLAAHKLCLKDTEYDAYMERRRDAWNSSAKEDHELAVFTSLVTMPSGWLLVCTAAGVWR
jgi:hypothetical protein